MDREMIFTRLPLGVSPDAIWRELLNRRKSKSTMLPLYNHAGQPFWYVTTEKMVAASEKVIDALYNNETEFDPYKSAVPVSTLEEAFYTSYVEGAQITMRDAMDFFTSERPPGDIEEQMLFNNREAANYAGQNLYRPIDEDYLKDLVYFLTDGMDGGGQEYRVTDDTETAPPFGETYSSDAEHYSGSIRRHPFASASN